LITLRITRKWLKNDMSFPKTMKELVLKQMTTFHFKQKNEHLKLLSGAFFFARR